MIDSSPYLSCGHYGPVDPRPIYFLWLHLEQWFESPLSTGISFLETNGFLISRSWDNFTSITHSEVGFAPSENIGRTSSRNSNSDRFRPARYGKRQPANIILQETPLSWFPLCLLPISFLYLERLLYPTGPSYHYFSNFRMVNCNQEAVPIVCS